MEYEAKRAVNFPVLDLLQLELHLGETRPGVKLEAFLVDLVQRWLAKDTARTVARESGPVVHGFQWKNLFLPDGTILRTGSGNEVEFAKVSSDHIVSNDGVMLTPSQFANRHSKGRNAWRFVWLRFPGEGNWVRADDCRARLGELPRKQSKGASEPYKTVQNSNADCSTAVYKFHGGGNIGLNYRAYG